MSTEHMELVTQADAGEGFHEDSLKKTTLLIELQTDVQGRKP